MSCKKIIPKVIFDESKILLLLAFPLIVSGIIESSLSFFSTLLLAHLSQEALAAGALVNWIFATLLVTIWGTLSAVSTLIAYQYGAQNHIGIIDILRSSLFFVTVISIPCMLIIWHLSSVLLWLGQDPKLIALAQPYLHGLTWAIFPDLIFTVLLQFVIGLGHTKTNLFFTLLWIPINISLNYMLMFGKFNLPALGIAGIGWGTTISFWLIAIIMVAYLLISKDYQFYRQQFVSKIQLSSLREILFVGFPIGVMFCIEVGSFTFITLLIGKIGNIALAANQIALQFLTYFSVISFSLASAITIRMGHRLGMNDKKTAKLTGYIGISTTVIFMCFIAVIYWKFPQQLIELDINSHLTKNHSIVETAKKILLICAFFQIFDGMRIATFGALRALKDTRFTLFVSAIIFFMITVPILCLMGASFNWQSINIWWGMVLSQVVMATLLMRRYRYKIGL